MDLSSRLRQVCLSISTILILSHISTSYAQRIKTDIEEGKVCMTVEHFHAANKTGDFFECTPLTDDEVDKFNLTGKYLGVWSRRSCPKGFEFDETKQRCEERKKRRRQQAACDLNPSSIGCQQACIAGNDNPTSGSECDWLSAELQPDEKSSSFFMQCAPQNPGQACGEWVRMPCTPGTNFNQAAQICIPKSVSRMQAGGACQPQGIPVCGCAPAAPPQQQCPGQCSCQQDVCCQPVQQPMPRPQPVMQPVCVGSSAPPVCSCDVGCPAQTSCQPQVGCCPVAQPAPIPVQQPMGLCSSNMPPVCSCDVGCPAQTQCEPQCGGCCPIMQPAPMPVQQPMGLCSSNLPPVCSCSVGCPQMTQCEPQCGGCCPIMQPLPMPMPMPVPVQRPMGMCSSNVPPVCSCDVGCPQMTQCEPQCGGCCPVQAPPPMPIQQPVPVCPGGSPSVQGCGYDNQCPQNFGCIQAMCCPMACPQQNQVAVGFCGQQNSCQQPAQCVQQTQCCCQQEAPQLPICPNGQTSNRFCTTDPECGPGMECSNGGCCPLPYCPSGVQSSGYCILGQGCPPGCVCREGLCCPMPQCPNGQQASRVCTNSIECGPGFECTNGGCCPLPRCPNGEVATERCQGVDCCCPPGQQCQNSVCCPLPRCPNGQVATTTCTGSFQCGPGFECVNGGCCPLPRCPDGTTATQRCQGGFGQAVGMFGGSCPSNQICENGVCCPCPICSNGMPANGLCGPGNSCPIGFICEGRGCCPEPMPLCPNGGRATQKCQRGVECPPGYGCTPEGACCLLSLEPVCPVPQTPVCQCSPTNACPQQASCNMGTCCASAPSPYYGNVVPGGQCQSSQQCNGNQQQCAECVQMTCVCTQGSWSNGATCQQSNQLQTARSGCDQYGMPCKFVLSTARRKPIFAPTGTIDKQEPLWYNVATPRRCLSTATDAVPDPDTTCLPNEKCINGQCKQKMWPGEYGCSEDLQCSSRCSNTYCELKKTDKGIGQCQCSNGHLLYGRCFTKCPAGFKESGAHCAHIDEEKFWKDAEAQDKFKALLNAGEC